MSGRGMVARLSSRFDLGGVSPYPVAVLTGLFAVDQFDNQVFGTLTPEITADLGITATTIGLISIPQLLIAMSVPLLFGFLGDRFNRVRVVAVAMLVWAVAALLTGLVTAVWMLLVLRVVSAMPKGANSVYASLIADWYPTRSRGTAYGIYNSGPIWGAGLAALAAGIIGDALGWRAAFMILAIPGFLLVIASLRLREPERGLIEAQEAGEVSAPPDRRLGPIRTARLLLTTTAFRWLCIGASIGFGGVALAGIAISFYYSAVFDVSPLWRGVIAALLIPFGIVALALGGLVGQRLMAANRADRVVVFAAACYLVSALCFFLLALVPNVVLAVAVAVLAQMFGSAASVPVYLLLAGLIPAQVRSQGFGVLVAATLLLTPFSVAIGLAVGDEYGFRYSMALAAPILVTAALCIWWASRTVRRDLDRANRVTLAALDARRRRQSGEAVGILDVRGLDVSYGSVQVLFGVDLHLAPGETIALLGTNGAGKSTLLKAISGLIAPTDGMVLVDGEDVSGIEAEVMAGHGVVMLPGGRGVFPGLTVQRNLELGAYIHGGQRAVVAESLERTLGLFPDLRPMLGQVSGTLSGGQQQMLMLAQGMMTQPRVLLIDELSLGLAPVMVEKILDIVADIKATGTSVIIVEQSVNVALSIAERAYFLEKGQVRFEGRTADLMGRDDLLRSIFLEGGARS